MVRNIVTKTYSKYELNCNKESLNNNGNVNIINSEVTWNNHKIIGSYIENGTSISKSTWRQLELDAAIDFSNYDAQKSLMIDVRGQNVLDETLGALYDDIVQRTNNDVEILFKMD